MKNIYINRVLSRSIDFSSDAFRGNGNFQKLKRLAVGLAGLFAVSIVGFSIAQSSPSTRKEIDLRTGPLVNSSDVANLVLDLSVEFPVSRNAYPKTTAYSSSTKYIGYHNSTTCYAYVGTSADGYFSPNGATDSTYKCNQGGTNGSGFSGNFLNYINTSSIDILRQALTGGDRYIDESSATVSPGVTPRTILQRAILPGDGRGQGGNRSGNWYDGDNGYDTANKNWGRVTLPAGDVAAGLVPFGTTTTVNIKACDDEIFFGTSNTGTCVAPGGNANLPVTTIAGPGMPVTTTTGTFKARVLVCDLTEGPIRVDVCKQQLDGGYKPVGEIQRNADKVRLSVFSYLNDSADWQKSVEGSRYGGVMRAPMKFTGPNIKSPAGIISPNPESEWDTNSGVFLPKPIDTANETGYTRTGVINYINMFGRHSRSDGRGLDLYKRRDPLGELFYESIRYYQNLQPTSTAIQNTTTVLMDGYPIYTNWTDPMQTSCQRNYALVVGDHQTSKDGSIPGSKISGQTRDVETITRDDPNGVSRTITVDADKWAKVISSFETNGNVSYTDSQGNSRTANGNGSNGTYGVKSGSPYNNIQTYQDGAGASYLYAGLAYWANTQSIRTDKPLARVRTFVLDVDEGGNGSIVRSRNLYIVGKYGGFSDVGIDQSPATGDGNPYKTYTNGEAVINDNEWLSADVDTSPVGYFMSNQPVRVLNAIKNIFAQASKPSGNIAGGSLSVSKLSKAKTSGQFYQSQINAIDWSGTLVRTELSLNTATNKVTVAAGSTWDAAKILTGYVSGTRTIAAFPTPANRNIISYSSTTLKGITLSWGNLDDSVKTSLKTNPSSFEVEADSVGQDRLDYIRGVRTGETNSILGFRPRNFIMGDSINSAPVLKGKPSANIVDSSYQTFYSSNAGRTGTVYVGSNDGMLHAFYAGESKTNSSNGSEQFAYVPRAVSNKLNLLTDPSYIKQAYVDGSMVVDEARIYRSSSTTSGAVGWGTALVSTMGGGAKGLFALDVTSPKDFSAKDVMWEFTNADDEDMGNLLGEPKIVKLAMGGTDSASPNYKWFAMATSGYNNYKTGGSNDKQALFLLSLEKAPGDAWISGTNYFKINVDNSLFSHANQSAATGLAMPGVAKGINGNVIYAYAGDLQGNLWKFDLRGNSSLWVAADVPVAKVLFIAKTSATAATVQPITVTPAVSLNAAGGFTVSFGTGKFIEPNDLLGTTADQQSIYGIWDSGDGKSFRRWETTSGSGDDSQAVNGLTSRTITSTAGTITTSITGSYFNYGKSTVSGANQYRGWYADFPSQMERSAVDPTVEAGLLALNSSIPGGDPCVSTGSASQYRYNPSTGISFTTTGDANTQGYLGSASLLEIGESTWSARTSTGRYIVTRKVSTQSPGVGGGLSSAESLVTVVGGRISWREISNF